MNNVLIVFASATSANRVKSVLRKSFGIDSALVQTPKALNISSGCSYCLKMRAEHLETAWKLVVSNGLSSKGAFDSKDYRKLK